MRKFAVENGTYPKVDEDEACQKSNEDHCVRLNCVNAVPLIPYSQLNQVTVQPENETPVKHASVQEEKMIAHQFLILSH